MNHCTGLLGKQCICGEWHEVDDFGIARSLLASPVVWIGGALSLTAWAALAYFV